MDNDTTVKTRAANSLTELQNARRAVEQAGMELSIHHTRQNKIALRDAQAKEQALTLKYYNDRLVWLKGVTQKQQEARRAQ